MNSIILATTSFIAGFLTALPICTTQIEVARRIIKERTTGIFMVILGAIASDFLYSLVVLFGIAPLIRDIFLETLIWFMIALVIFILGLLIIIYSNSHKTDSNVPLLKNKASFIVGFIINTANPYMLFLWLFILEFFKSLGIFSAATFHAKVILISSVLFGMFLCYFLFAKFVEKLGKLNFTRKYENKINKTLGILLILIAIYFIYKSIGVGFILKFNCIGGINGNF